MGASSARRNGPEQQLELLDTPDKMRAHFEAASGADVHAAYDQLATAGLQGRLAAEPRG
jgi:hypothetical protein